jgi:hypothetical protein
VRSAALRAGLRRKEEDFLFPFPAVETAGYYQSSPFGDCARACGREEGLLLCVPGIYASVRDARLGDMPCFAFGSGRPKGLPYKTIGRPLAGLVHGGFQVIAFLNCL